MEPKPLFDVKYWEDAYRFLQKIDEASRLKILENIDKASSQYFTSNNGLGSIPFIGNTLQRYKKFPYM